MEAISVNNISKSYGRVKALDDVSFAVGKGEVFGLIGPGVLRHALRYDGG